MKDAIKTVNNHCVIVSDAKRKYVYYIYSYDTLVLTVNGYGSGIILHRDWSGYSATTLRDINKCLELLHISVKMNKKLWDELATADKPISNVN